MPEALCIWSARLGINARGNELSDADARRLESVMEQLDPQLSDGVPDAATIETITEYLDWLQEAHQFDAKGTPPCNGPSAHCVRRRRC